MFQKKLHQQYTNRIDIITDDSRSVAGRNKKFTLKRHSRHVYWNGQLGRLKVRLHKEKVARKDLE